MGWTQEDIVKVYRSVKNIAASIDTDNRSREHIVSEIKRKLRFQFGYRPYVRCSALFNNRHRRYSGADKKFKKFVKPKYNKIGLPSKEISMLNKMIDSVVDGLQCNETSLCDLDNAVSKMGTITHRAKNINDDCEDIIDELDKISDYLYQKCQSI